MVRNFRSIFPVALSLLIKKKKKKKSLQSHSTNQESFSSNDLDQRVLIFVYQWLIILKTRYFKQGISKLNCILN